MQAKPYLCEVSVERPENVSGYPYDIPAIAKLKSLKFHADVTFLIGENGSGKPTILEAIALAMGFSPEGGTKNMLFQTADTISPLHEILRTVCGHRRPSDWFFLRAESFYNMATYADEVGVEALMASGGVSLHKRSHGEAFLAVMNNKLRDGLYLFDEPESALSPTRQMSALASIHRLVNAGSQFIIATHSPILLAYPKSKIVLLNGDGLRNVRYEETEHYAITRRFLNDYKGMLEKLL